MKETWTRERQRERERAREREEKGEKINPVKKEDSKNEIYMNDSDNDDNGEKVQ